MTYRKASRIRHFLTPPSLGQRGVDVQVSRAPDLPPGVALSVLIMRDYAWLDGFGNDADGLDVRAMGSEGGGNVTRSHVPVLALGLSQGQLRTQLKLSVVQPWANLRET